MRGMWRQAVVSASRPSRTLTIEIAKTQKQPSIAPPRYWALAGQTPVRILDNVLATPYLRLHVAQQYVVYGENVEGIIACQMHTASSSPNIAVP